MTKNLIIIDSEVAAGQYRDVYLELLVQDLELTEPLETADNIARLGKDLQGLLSVESKVAYEAFLYQFKSGGTMMLVSNEDADRLEKWNDDNEEFSIAVFKPNGTPVGLYSKEDIAW